MADELQRYIQGGSDDREVLPRMNVPCQGQNGGARSYNDGIIREDQFGGRAADPRLFFPADLFLFINRLVIDIRVIGGGAAMRTEKQAFIFQEFQVLTNGDRRNVQLFA